MKTTGRAPVPVPVPVPVSVPVPRFFSEILLTKKANGHPDLSPVACSTRAALPSTTCHLRAWQ